MGYRPSKDDNDAASMYMLSETGSDYIAQARERQKGRGTMRYRKIIAAALALALGLLAGCSSREAADPYAGMVQVESGFGHKMWVTLHEDVPANPLTAEDFAEGKYTGGDYIVHQGIDVSEHQGAVDWEAVAGDGISFAIIRAGYRGYSEGGLFVDDYFFDNMDGAIREGLDIGVYFFSQATSPEEAIEEADFLIDEMLSSYPAETFTLPVFYDWESITTDDARTDGLGGEVLTECALAFCARLAERGYTPGVYAYRNLGYFSYDLPRMTHLTWWMAALNDYPDFYYKHDFWQYSITGSVAGIDGEVDRNMMFIRNEPATATDVAEQ